MIAEADLYLDSRIKSNGLSNVKLRVYYNREYRYYSTDIDLEPAEYIKTISKNGKEKKKMIEGTGGLVKILTAQRRSKEQNEIYTKLIAYLTKANNIIKKFDTVFTFEMFEELYLERRDVFGSVSFAFDRHIEKLETADRIATASSYRCAKISLLDFHNNPKKTKESADAEKKDKKAGEDGGDSTKKKKQKDLRFTDITPGFLNKYEKWMSDNGNSLTTVGIYLRALRSIFNKEKIDRKLYPFGSDDDGLYEIPSGKNIKKALTLDEISKIFNYEAESDQEAKARDYWMFLYLCNGMNVKDFCSLKWENIDGEFLTYKREKTKRTRKDAKKITVSLKSETWDVINKYGIRSMVADDYIFPHYYKGITAIRKQEVSQQLIKTINKYMKRISGKVGIKQNVTTYFARHSFATILKRSGADVSMISDLLGHSNVNVTENYLDSFEDDQIKRQTDVLLSFNKKAQ
ncbi:tyrosine-type recombinase/integrase [Proteiniphilum saccharofermentans]|uniref:tyrosine-type recombinase/integrase n=1 Tax=Proteiniphilum saccharofermentans TaxID=1642647 RepID=UPI0028B25CD3|nr:tyrosine-type recombinase/integrase [Proteiniphilum saccharofermentans]